MPNEPKEWKNEVIKIVGKIDELSRGAMPSMVLETIEKSILALILDAENRKMESAVEEIKRMKLWSKGNVEGTRNDIIARLESMKK